MVRLRFGRRSEVERRRLRGVLDAILPRVPARPASDVEREAVALRPAGLSAAWRRPRPTGSTH